MAPVRGQRLAQVEVELGDRLERDPGRAHGGALTDVGTSAEPLGILLVEAASDLAAKADSALNSSGTGGPKPPGAGDVDKYFHDLGVLTYLEASGRAADAAERTRVMGALQELDSSGAIRSFGLHTAPPPAPGMAGAVPPPPGMAGQAPPPPMPGMGAPAAPPAPAEAAPPAPAAPAAPVTPPPPPSWMTGGDAGA